jgi:hypothetical protein
MDKIKIPKYVREMTTPELEHAYFSSYLPAECKIIISREYWDRTGKKITNLFRY